MGLLSRFALGKTFAPRPRASSRPRFLRLALESLQDRILPSTFTVLKLGDSGAGSLRDAVLQANTHTGSDVIRFADGLQGTIHLIGGELTITDNLTIVGPGANKITISGHGANRVISIASDLAVAISDLTVAHGRVTDTTLVTPMDVPVTMGGGILNVGSKLDLSGMVFDDNQAEGFIAAGGAIATVSGASLTVTNCAFINNVVVGEYLAVGGGIYQDDASTLTAQHSVFSANRVTALLGGNDNPIPSGEALGGGIGSGSASHTTVLQCVFTNNLVKGGDGDAGQFGGNSTGGAVLSTNLSLFTADNADAVFTAVDCTFTANRAVGGAGGNGARGGDADGGALNPGRGGQNTIVHCVFVENQAVGGAGGHGVQSDGGTGGDGNGGAIENGRSTIQISASVFLRNRAVGGQGGDASGNFRGGQGGEGFGGALGVANNSVADIDTSLFQDNRSLGGNGGRGASGGDGGYAIGAAITLGGITLTNNIFSISGSAIIGNNAVGGCGGEARGNGVGGHGGNGVGGGIGSDTGATVSISGTLITRNLAAGGAGAAGGDGGDGLGGGVYVVGGDSSLTLKNSRFVYNRAAQGTAGTGGSDGVSMGGGLYLEGDLVEDAATVILGNFADLYKDCYGC